MQQQLQRNTRAPYHPPSLQREAFLEGHLQRKSIASWAAFISHARLAQPPSPFLPLLINCQLQCDREPARVQTAFSTPTPTPQTPIGWGSGYLDLWLTGSCLKFLLRGMPVITLPVTTPPYLLFSPLGTSFSLQGYLSPPVEVTDGWDLSSLSRESLSLLLTFHSGELSDCTGTEDLP